VDLEGKHVVVLGPLADRRASPIALLATAKKIPGANGTVDRLPFRHHEISPRSPAPQADVLIAANRAARGVRSPASMVKPGAVRDRTSASNRVPDATKKRPDTGSTGDRAFFSTVGGRVASLHHSGFLAASAPMTGGDV